MMKRLYLYLSAVLCMSGTLGAYTFTETLGAAGGWDDVSKSKSVSVVMDRSDYTLDVSSTRVESALSSAFQTWDSVSGASNLSFSYLSDNGGNYDVFDPGGYELDQSADWRYANIAIGGFLPQSYFLSLDPNGASILAVSITARLSGGGSRKPEWHSEIFFNDAFNWTDDATTANSGEAIDIETVALHEIGHSLGLDHEDDVDSVMASYYGGVKRDLTEDDINGIVALYGSGSGGGGGGKGGKGGGGRGKPNLFAGDLYYVSGATFLDGGLQADFMTVSTPEPGTITLVAMGGAALLRKRRTLKGCDV